MKRILSGLLISVLAIGLLASGAAADKKKAKKSKKAAEAPASEMIAKSMAELKWGMPRAEVAKVFTQKIKAKYKPLVAKTRDAVEEDRLRTELHDEIKALRNGQVEFTGRSTGWDVSFLKGEFSHNNNESMLVMRDENSQNFYFFLGDRLWKWYKAFDSNAFPAGGFAGFSAAVQRRFGVGKEVQGQLRPGDDQRHWLEWQDKTTRLRAVDQTAFYGFFCIVFEDKETVNTLAKLRPAAVKTDLHHALVDSVTGERSTDPDDSPNIADRITGKLREVEQAPEESETPKAGGAKTKRSKSASAPSSTGVSADDDPLRGL